MLPYPALYSLLLMIITVTITIIVIISIMISITIMIIVIIMIMIMVMITTILSSLYALILETSCCVFRLYVLIKSFNCIHFFFHLPNARILALNWKQLTALGLDEDAVDINSRLREQRHSILTSDELKKFVASHGGEHIQIGADENFDMPGEVLDDMLVMKRILNSFFMKKFSQ